MALSFRRSVAAAMLLAGVSACSDGTQAAEDRYRMAMKSALTDDERCQIERDLTQAYLDARSEEKYKKQKFQSDSFCFNLQVMRAIQSPVR